ncbi:MAG: TonB-dependent receptor, partial [candidate division Zixibacteria bacterium]|nr:TonB-dependent receptor [candidate division Zixibacteria bacterium]
YKDFQNPIERVIFAQSDAGQIIHQNVERAKVWGMEFEVRKRLDQLFSKMRNFHLGGNLTLAHSQVDIPRAELVKLLAIDPHASETRPLQGQSNYVLNLNIGFESFKSGTTVGIYYNIFGTRLAEVATGGAPNVYEKPRDVVDLVFSQRLMAGFGMKFGVKDLLDVDRTKAQTYKGIDYITSQYGTGRTFSLGINYEI